MRIQIQRNYVHIMLNNYNVNNNDSNSNNDNIIDNDSNNNNDNENINDDSKNNDNDKTMSLIF